MLATAGPGFRPSQSSCGGQPGQVMRLTNFQITNFRSIEDSGDIPIERVTCFVGKNESGKTNCLQALVRINPAPGQPANFDINDDYPRKGLGDIEHDIKSSGFVYPKVVRATYALDGPEVDVLTNTFGEGAVQLGDDSTVAVTVDYARHRTWDVKVDEALVVAHLISQSGANLGAAKPKSIAKLLEMADTGTHAELAEVAQTVRGWRDQSPTSAAIDVLRSFEPLYVYFDDYDRMAGEGNVRELLAKRSAGGHLTPPERTFLALIDEARIDLDDLGKHDYNALRNRLESASIRISEELYTYWSQNQTSSIDFDHTYEPTPDNPQGRGDLILKVRVKDNRHGVSVPVDRSSNGFIWFFSFLVNFAQIRKEYPGRSLVLLLDEPGTALHGLAQRDFLKVLDNRLADHQILYTTHQPFLVDPDRLDRARPVVDMEPGGTTVRPHAYNVDRDTLFPLQAALGYEIGQTLFVAPNVLLVEGTSDLVYLQLLSRACEMAGQAGLDRRWTITPVGGVDKMDTFVRLFRGQQLNICALIDVTGNKLSKVEKLVRDGDLQADQVVKVSAVLGVELADIEDLMSEAFYLRLVQGVGGEDSARAIYGVIQQDRLPDATEEPRITKRIDAVLEGFGQGRLDHLPPALYFERHQSELLPELDTETIQRAAKLFGAANSQLRS
ncbi:MAG TPA: AAA family ATPase [Acidimicrobiales bacterium]|nr:AAA family ATPase [Acidimicrobiales bacterium]